MHASPNQYEQVIQAVGSILREYDSDKMIPLYGFGARVPRADGTWGAVSHCFPLNLQTPHSVYQYR